MAPPLETVAQIDKAAAAADAYAKARPGERRYFGRRDGLPQDTTPWRKYASVTEFEAAMRGTALFEIATVTIQPSKVLRVEHEISSEDFVLYATYYYRPNGTLALIRSRLNTFHGNVSSLSKTYYDPRGAALRRVDELLDLETQQKVNAAERPFMDVDRPVYLSPSELPFFHLLRN